jgi:hypothetical protein
MAEVALAMLPEIAHQQRCTVEARAMRNFRQPI